MLIDEIEIVISGGHGGAGKVSFGPKKFSGPDGGNGGRGGDVYLKVTPDLSALNQFTKNTEVSAEDGIPGDNQKRYGKDGKDLTLILPVGTELKDKETKEVIELLNLDDEILICKGGLGGKGNFEFRSPTNTTPTFAQKGLPGQRREFEVHLKLLADFGFIGLPNAGKSSLLNELTRANVKVGNYPFTTLEPSLGVCNGKVLADIPGLIEGASTGKGLGIKFLKHIEKVRVLLHCINAESEDLVNDYKIIRKELGEFNKELLDKKEVIVLTKTDLVSKEDLEEKVKLLKKLNPEIYCVSIYDFDSLENLKKILN